TIAAEGGGGWKEYAGGYSDWANYQASVHQAASDKAKVDVRPAARPVAAAAKAKGDKLSWKEQRELEALPERIAALETEQGQLTTLLEDPAIYQRDAKAAQQAAERLAAIDDELMELLERWETLESRAANQG
ncbi:MAG: ABC transporter ATP-binding protein, partial [Dechloromonas sp.]